MRLILILMSTTLLSGCAWLAEGRDPDLPSAGELGAGVCRPAGPHDPAAPGEWVCDDGDSGEEMRPRHRVERPQDYRRDPFDR